MSGHGGYDDAVRQLDLVIGIAGHERRQGWSLQELADVAVHDPASAALIHHIRVVDRQFILDRHRGRVADDAMARIDAAIRLVLNVA